MPSAGIVTAKVWDKTRDDVKPLAAALGATDDAVYGAAVAEFKTIPREQQRVAIAKYQRRRGVRHPRVGRGNKLAGSARP